MENVSKSQNAVSPCIQFFSINGEPKVGVVYDDPESLFEIIVTIMPDKVIMDAIKEAVILFLDSTNRNSEKSGMLIALDYVFSVIENTKSNKGSGRTNNKKSIPVIDPELALNSSIVKSVGG